MNWIASHGHRGLTLLLLASAVTAACANTAANTAAGATETPSTCAAIDDNQARLACYDRLYRTQVTAPAAAAAAAATDTTPPPSRLPLAAAAASAPSDAEQQRIRQERLGSSLGERWELDAGSSLGSFLPRSYKPMYVLPVVATSRVNRQPSSGAPDHSVSEPIDLMGTEAKFQISLKLKLWESVLGAPGSLWLGYTQSSRWQIYNADLSRPFRETNYEPELMYVWPTDYRLFGWRGRMLGVSLNHQSNGRAMPLSRSWNRVIAEAGFERGDWTVAVRPWWRLKEDGVEDDNPHIEHYIGRGELLLTRKMQGHTLALQLRHSLRSDPAGGSVQFDWAFPLVGTLHGYLQLFHGYGESLIDFNFRQSRAGLGVSVVEWR